MEHYVYKIVNSQGEVEWVGESMELKGRLKQHKSKNGKFYRRTDIEMRICGIFQTKSEAFVAQCLLQKYYGFQTDSEKIGVRTKGKPKSAETKLKLSLALKGKPRSEEIKQKISKSSKLYWSNKQIPPSTIS
jgi:predicted GIY-YIG superfamily endonuclease